LTFFAKNNTIASMRLLLSRYPGIHLGHFRELAQLVVVERNGAIAMTAMYQRHTWSRGALAYEATMRRIEDLAREKVHPWLVFAQETGLAYVVEVDGIPVRIQRDDGTINVAMAHERKRLEELGVQTLMFPDTDNGVELLRMEVEQTPGKPVSRVTLSLFQEHSGATLDKELLYDVAGDGVSTTELPPEDVDDDADYEFVDDDTDSEAEDG
jgi:hypothetical protein